MKTSAKARAKNRAYRSKMKMALRKVQDAKTTEEGQTAFTEASKLLDRLAGKGIIHKNRAADKKSRLYSYIQTIGS